jgi:ribosomal protein S18 acetylase RimI-like enzyme
MERIEAESRRLGCHGAWLDTSNPKARAFYERLGYREFGRIANEVGEQPEGFSRSFSCKRF